VTDQLLNSIFGYLRRSNWSIRCGLLLWVTIILVLIFFIYPSYNHVKELDYQLSKINEELVENVLPAEKLKMTPLQSLSEFENSLPNARIIPDTLLEISKILTDAGLKISEADYRLMIFSQNHFNGYQINMPIRGRYTSIIDACLLILNKFPNLDLNNISFQRKSLSDFQTDATISMTLYLKKE
jgi:hypothetical protein